MKAFPIPVRSIGPGSQPAEEVELAVMQLPQGMATFEMPRVPERVGAAVMRESAALLQRLLVALAAHDAAQDAQGLRLPLDGLSPAALAVTNQVLGEGEVSIRLAGTPTSGTDVHAQESVFTGLWRCGELGADGRLARYWLEVGGVPMAVLRAARVGGGTTLAGPDAWPEGTMNAPALLAELRARVASWQGGGPGGQINLSLLPLSPADHQVLAQALPVGPVAIISRGFGNCHIGSTLIPGVWREQFFNSMNTLILDLVEVTDIPEVATASPEDIEDTRERLAELVRWMSEAADDEPATH